MSATVPAKRSPRSIRMQASQVADRRSLSPTRVEEVPSDISLSLSEGDTDDLEEREEPVIESGDSFGLDFMPESGADDGQDDFSVSEAAGESGEFEEEEDDETEDGEDSSLFRASGRKLTARQKSRIEAESLSTMPSLDNLTPAYLLPRQLTEEEQLKKSEKSRRRMMQRDQKLEQSKADTIQRLLQKQSTRSKKMQRDSLIATTAEPVEEATRIPRKPLIPAHGWRLVATSDGMELILGEGMPKLVRSSLGTLQEVAVRNCSVKGCPRKREFLHSKTRQPLCSLECYRISNDQRCT